MAERSPTPQSPPSAQIVSYSGPSPLSRAVAVRRAQPIEQPRQALRLRVKPLRSASPEIASACSNCDSRKLRVGNAPAWFSTLTRTAVPNSGSACEVTGFDLSILPAS